MSDPSTEPPRRFPSSFSEAMEQLFVVHPETEVHPHVPEEKAELFHALDAGATELEYLNLIHAIVYATKPSCALETGSHFGCGTIAIADALRLNGVGELHSLELRSDRSAVAREALADFDPRLAERVTIHETESVAWLETWSGPPFDFALFDSDLGCRHLEFETILRRSLFGPGAVALFHDTSRLRGETYHSASTMIEALDRHAEGREHFEFPLSRGLRMLRLE